MKSCLSDELQFICQANTSTCTSIKINIAYFRIILGNSLGRKDSFAVSGNNLWKSNSLSSACFTEMSHFHTGEFINLLTVISTVEVLNTYILEQAVNDRATTLALMAQLQRKTLLLFNCFIKTISFFTLIYDGNIIVHKILSEVGWTLILKPDSSLIISKAFAQYKPPLP